MDNVERVREPAPETLTPEFLEERRKAGWRLVAVEWERVVQPGTPARVELPFGWKVAEDGRHLEEDAEEQKALLTMMDMIVADLPISAAANELNKRGFRMRNGMPWTPAAVFDLLPRLIESGPRIFSSPAWIGRSRAAAQAE